MVTYASGPATRITPVQPLIALALAAITAAPALGQQPGGRPPFDGGGRGGRMGGGGMVMGTVRQIDAARNAVQVQMAGPQGESRWVVISPQAAVTRQVQGTLAELKPNDTIAVAGIPLAIQASQIQVGEMSLAGGGGAAGGPAAGAAGRGGQGPGGGPGGPGGPATRATGTIVSTNPLVVMLPGNVRVNVTADASTRVSRIVRVPLSELKVGETLMAIGQPDDGGNVVAMRVEVGGDPNAGFGGRSFGGGGFGGGGGFRQRPGGGGDQP